MASSGTKRSLSNRGPFLLLLALAWTVTCSLTESDKPIQLNGEVGGNVTFQCPVDDERKISFFYFQRGGVFVNGYHAERDIDFQWQNTRLDSNRKHVHMYRLNISHTGMYTCCIWYDNSQHPDETFIQLNVTASYSKPDVTQSCDDAGCSVTCAFYGGYPGNKVEWKIQESRNTHSQRLNVENNTQVPSPSTMLVNSTSTVSFNCSHGEIRNLSCSVGNVTSDWFPVCDRKPEVKPTSHSPIIIAVAVCGLILVLLVGVVVFCRRKKRQAGQDQREKNENYEESKDLQFLEKEPF